MARTQRLIILTALGILALWGCRKEDSRTPSGAARQTASNLKAKGESHSREKGPHIASDRKTAKSTVAPADDVAASSPKLVELRAEFNRLRKSTDRRDIGHVYEDLLLETRRIHGDQTALNVARADAGLYLGRRDFALAASLYSAALKVISDSSHDGELKLHLGEALKGAGRLAEAEQTWDELVHGNITSDIKALAWLNLAEVRADAGKMDAALQTLDEMATYFRGRRYADSAQLRRGDLLLKAGRREDSRIAYMKCRDRGTDFQIRSTAQGRLDWMDKHQSN